jgi:hypothetical protein
MQKPHGKETYEDEKRLLDFRSSFFALNGCRSERARPAMVHKIVMVMGILVAMCATGLISVVLLWLLGSGNDPLVTLASAPF